MVKLRLVQAITEKKKTTNQSNGIDFYFILFQVKRIDFTTFLSYVQVKNRLILCIDFI